MKGIKNNNRVKLKISLENLGLNLKPIEKVNEIKTIERQSRWNEREIIKILGILKKNQKQYWIESFWTDKKIKER